MDGHLFCGRYYAETIEKDQRESCAADRFVVIHRLRPKDQTAQLMLLKLGTQHEQVFGIHLPMKLLNLWRFYNDRRASSCSPSNNSER